MALLVLGGTSPLVPGWLPRSAAGSGPTCGSRARGGCGRSGSSATCPTSSTSSRSRCGPGSATVRRSSGSPSRSAARSARRCCLSLRQMELGATRRDAFLAMSRAQLLGIAEEHDRRPGCRRRSSACRCRRRSTTSRRTCAAPPHQAARRRAARAAPRVSLIVTTLIVPGAMILILMTLFLKLRHPRQRAAPLGARACRSASASAAPRAPAAGWSRRASDHQRARGHLLVTPLSPPDQDERSRRSSRSSPSRGRDPAALLGPVGPALVRHGLLRRRAGAHHGDPAAHRRRKPVR